jgi:hypothetical protein
LHWTDRSAENDRTYFYNVSGLNGAGESYQGDEPQVRARKGSAGVIGQLPAPTGITAVPSGSHGQITVRWTPVEHASSYNVARSSTPGGPYTEVIPLNTTSTTLTDKVLPGHTYYYVVSSINTDPATRVSSGRSLNSAEVVCAAAPLQH